MNRPLLLGIVAAFAALLVAFAFLAAWEPKPPIEKIEKVIPNERLPR